MDRKKLFAGAGFTHRTTAARSGSDVSGSGMPLWGWGPAGAGLLVAAAAVVWRMRRWQVSNKRSGV